MIGTANAQDTLALDPNEFVNVQILNDQASASPHDVYSVAAGAAYALDGRLDLTFPVEIVGPDNGWIVEDATPPMLVNTPDEQGAARQFFELQEGGSLVLKNLIMSGLVSTGEIVSEFITNTGGSNYMAHNVVFSDWTGFAVRNQAQNIDISVTDCVFINGVRTSNSPWGGFPIRMDVAGENVTIENNTVVNSGRLLTNSGPFFNATIHELHNTYLNSTKAGHEQRANEMIQANNIYYNYDFLGRHISNNTYDSHWTTWNYFADVADSLENNSLYLGHNLFYREPDLLDWFATQQDTILPGLLWEHADVDSIVTMDDDYTIGTNYAEFDPEFTTPPGNSAEILAFTTDYWLDNSVDWVDWRIAGAVSFNETSGLPELTGWPPAFDLSYGNTFLQTGGSDGLPVGDLNWFPEAKESYYANRDMHIETLQALKTSDDGVYVPGSPTPLITPTNVSVEDGELPGSFSLDQNFPNPFNPTTSIAYRVESAEHIRLEVFDLLGRSVSVLIDGVVAQGEYTYQFDAGNLPSGMYLYRLSSGSETITRKMMLLK
ncbi:MAG: T9SS type A sorting domain-containing protein [Rhodothermaceae bacterium]|nr:T9SS type A sorting domain-containing protein [Rhodothermaceae bacterium]